MRAVIQSLVRRPIFFGRKHGRGGGLFCSILVIYFIFSHDDHWKYKKMKKNVLEQKQFWVGDLGASVGERTPNQTLYYLALILRIIIIYYFNWLLIKINIEIQHYIKLQVRTFM